MKIQFWGVVLATITFGSCQNISPDTNSINPYFSVDSLIELQFSETQPIVSIMKQVQIDNDSDSSMVEMDSSTFRKELKIFSEIDLNKSDLIGVYDESQEGNKIIYTKKPSEKSGIVTRMEVMQNGDLITIIAETLESNSLYDSKREYLLQFKEGKLEEYIISGNQKIVMKEASTFVVKGKLEK